MLPSCRKAAVLVLLIVLGAIPAVAGDVGGGRSTSQHALTVLLIYTEPRLAPSTVAIDEAFRSTLEATVKRPVFFYTEYLDLHAPEAAQAEMRGLLVRKYAGRPLDLVFAVSSPALRFAAAHRRELFRNAPLVFAAVDPSAMAGATLPPDVTGTWLKQGWALTLDAALRFHPGARRAVVVVGTGAPDKVWLAEARAQLEPYRSRIEIAYPTGAPFGDVLTEVAALPAGTLLLLGPFTRDADNREFIAAQALKTIGAVATVPTYSLGNTVLGTGIIGGNVVSFRMHGIRSAQLAAAMLAGARPAPTSGGTNQYVFDSRQLTRWSIDERLLPPGSEVLYRAPSAWELYRWYIVGAALIIAVQGTLIGALLVSRHQRRRAQTALAEELSFETLVSEIATACAGATLDQLDERIHDCLRRVVMFLGVDRGSLWQQSQDRLRVSVTHFWHRQGAGAPPAAIDLTSFAHFRRRVQTGEVVCVERPDDLPSETSDERVAMTQAGIRSFAAIPLLGGDRMLGFLVLLSLHAERRWPARVRQQLRTLAEPFSTALIRLHSAAAVESSAAITGAVLAALPGETAIIDAAGTIVQTNDAWTSAARSAGTAEHALKVGGNYLEACRATGDMPPDLAHKLHAAIESILRGEQDESALEYPTTRHGEDRWFEVRVRRLARLGGGAAVMHFDVTARRQAEAAAQRHLGQIAHLDRVAGMAQLASSLAHELNQPLTAILSNAQAAARLLGAAQPDLPEVRACLADIVSDDHRAAEVIRRIRGLLKKTDFVSSPLALNDLVATTIRLVANEALLRAVSITFNPAPALPVVLGDLVQIQQVILNLLTNAIAAASESTAEQNVVVWTGVMPGYVEVGVHDSGPGIAEAALEHVFEPFFTTKEEGLGMGLTISRAIVDSHGGRLLVENDPAGGATFRVLIPSEHAVAG